jgi:hypothetical protein
MSEASQYEFSPEQDKTFDQLGYKMQGVGTMGLLLGLLSLMLGGLLMAGFYQITHSPDPAVQAKIQAPPATLYAVAGIYVVSGLVYLSIGFWTRSSGSAFRNIAATQGNDVNLLMTAVEKLYKMYSLVYSMILIGLLLFVITLILGLVLAFMSK